MLTSPQDAHGRGVGVGSRFPVGYHALHPDVALNFQLNRFWNWVGEDRMLAQLRDAASRIVTYQDWTRELLALGEQALAEARPLPAAYLFRMAEFFPPRTPASGRCASASSSSCEQSTRSATRPTT